MSRSISQTKKPTLADRLMSNSGLKSVLNKEQQNPYKALGSTTTTRAPRTISSASGTQKEKSAVGTRTSYKQEETKPKKPVARTVVTSPKGHS